MRNLLSVFLVLFSLIVSADAQIVRITSKVKGNTAVMSTGFFVDGDTIVATDHSADLGDEVVLHSVHSGPVPGSVMLKELGKAKVVYECTNADMGHTDDIIILRLDKSIDKVKNPLTLSPLRQCNGVEAFSPGFPEGKPGILSIIGESNRQNSIGEVFHFKVLYGSSLCIGGCSGSPVQGKELGGYVVGMISKNTQGGRGAIVIPGYIIQKHLDAYRDSLTK